MLTVLAVGFAMTSCGDDDETPADAATLPADAATLPADAATLYGLWTYSVDDYTENLYFSANGSGYSLSDVGTEYEDKDNFTYTYNSGIIVILYEGDDDETETLQVLTLTSNLLTIKNEDGDVATFTRVS